MAAEQVGFQPTHEVPTTSTHSWLRCPSCPFCSCATAPGRFLVRCDVFDDSTEALEAFARAEGEHRGVRGVEVVLLGSDSLETLKRTHGHYLEAATAPDLSVLSR